mmetsp:Transcript_3984/g.12045  ORF Transcript_3984/g.12045 Transcript_3984/m.12045 type:complete len:406 (-) Transcript_3984:847-2064(-)
MRLAPLAVSTTGRGSSGVGLTAAVVKDMDTGESRLEAGAAVLADRGVVCIDEFDKMSMGDRVAIHEVMEQQTVTVAKAGLHASLNARCALLAAANPVYGNYDTDRRPQDNIGLPDSLLSRFDLLFILLDTIDRDSDQQVANHVLRSHQFNELEPSSRTCLYGSNTLKAETLRPDEDAALPASQKSTTLHPEFIRRYVYFARHQMEATLSENACQNIASAYADLRAKADERTLPVTARCLESLIRLATANAKVRLSEAVDERDCNAALELLSPPRRVNKTRLYTLRLQCHSFAMFGDARRSNAETTSASGSLASKLSIFRANKVPRLENSILDFNRANFISGVYTDIMNEKDDGTCQLTELANVANASLPQGASAFSLAEIEEILKKQQKENRLMYDETNRAIHLL